MSCSGRTRASITGLYLSKNKKRIWLGDQFTAQLKRFAFNLNRMGFPFGHLSGSRRAGGVGLASPTRSIVASGSLAICRRSFVTRGCSASAPARLSGLRSRRSHAKASKPCARDYGQAQTGLVTLRFRPLNSFMRPFVRRPRGFCRLAMSGDGAGYRAIPPKNGCVES
jgi:hypothetical protein